MTYLKSGNVAAVLRPLGVSARQLQMWCERDAAGRAVITPAAGGNGKGECRLFTPMQTVGIAVAAQAYASDRGCSPEYVRVVVAAFAGMSEDDLLAAFVAGRTHLAGVEAGRPVLAGEGYDRPDVRAAHADVTGAVARVEERNKGRTRRAAGAVKQSSV